MVGKQFHTSQIHTNSETVEVGSKIYAHVNDNTANVKENLHLRNAALG